MKKRSLADFLLIGTRGLGMGAADVIPGVSGGTIAFITGIYEELIHSIKSFDKTFINKLLKEGIAPAWKYLNGNFLLAVFSGVLISIFSLARLISWLLDTYPMLVWAFFFGLIIGSAIHIGRKIPNWNFPVIIMLVLGTAVAFYITIAAPATSPETHWFVFLSGMIAISAMILPGISGSFILLLMGKYEFMLNVIRDLRISYIIVFGIGCLLGIIAFSNIISWLFKRFHEATLALLTGFMLGSLNKLWPWKEVIETRISSRGEVVPFLEHSISPWQYEAIHGSSPQLLPVIIAALAGLALIMIFEFSEAKQKA
jgi:putative membrane protein